jgi:hypothetical protein
MPIAIPRVPKYDMRTMLAENGGPVTIMSVLCPQIPGIKEEVLEAIRNATIVAAVNKADEKWPGQKVTVRDLNASDMDYSNNIFTETSNASANAWNAMAFGAFTVDTGTIIGIYGLGLSVIHNGTITQLPITGVRIEVGGARVAQWHVQSLQTISSAATTAQQVVHFGIAKSPIIVQEDMTVTIYEYTRTASTVYEPCWLGVTIEKEGITLRA